MMLQPIFMKKVDANYELADEKSCIKSVAEINEGEDLTTAITMKVKSCLGKTRKRT